MFKVNNKNTRTTSNTISRGSFKKKTDLLNTFRLLLGKSFSFNYNFLCGLLPQGNQAVEV